MNALEEIPEGINPEDVVRRGIRLFRVLLNLNFRLEVHDSHHLSHEDYDRSETGRDFRFKVGRPELGEKTNPYSEDIHQGPVFSSQDEKFKEGN
jgi:hypothetical protein